MITHLLVLENDRAVKYLWIFSEKSVINQLGYRVSCKTTE